jgi:SAM-dependent methyltransferase
MRKVFALLKLGGGTEQVLSTNKGLIASMFDLLHWKIRQAFCPFKRAVDPSQWLMNLDVPAYTEPSTPDSILHQKHLLERFPHFDDLPSAWAWVKLESLYQLDQIATLLQTHPIPQGETCHWVDVGSKNGTTLGACVAVAAQLGEKVQITGLELDTFRYYLDGYTRGDYGRGLVKSFAETPALNALGTLDFVEADVNNYAQTHPATADVVSCFLPFVLAKEHTAWGLPKQDFNPHAFFKSVWSLLKPNGVLLISNLSEDEVHAQRQCLDALEADSPEGQGMLRHIEALEIETRFMKCSEERRFLWMLQKIS